MIPKNITREHVVKAIEEIDIVGIRKGRHSSTYDLIYNNKAYPPKLVLSIANRFVNGKELNPNDFDGGKGTETFKFFEDQGFTILEKIYSQDYDIITEYVNLIKSNKIQAADSIKLLILKDHFENNIKVLDQIFFNEKLKIIDSTNYHHVIDFLIDKHKIVSGEYNDFNIWSASRSYLKKVSPKLVERHNELNLKVGFSDNKNGIYKSFFGERNLISYLNKKFNNSSSNKQYWLYSPGENARNWEEFYSNGVMALGWDEIGDLRNYDSRIEIKNALTNTYGGDGSKKNDVSANDDFLNKIKIGDVVIVKKGRTELLGYGVVTSDYQYDQTRTEYHSFRTVDWKHKGNWELDFSLVLKTLTDITKYKSEHPDYDTYHERLLGIMEQNYKNENKERMNLPLNIIFYGPPGTGKTYHTIIRAAQIIKGAEIDSYEEALEIFNSNLHNRIEFITFHQNYNYEDFIQGLRPETDSSSTLVFEKKDGVFKRIADRALENLKLAQDVHENGQKVSRENYVIIIDEINRANISRVFGELITLIEPDKRSHGSIPLEARLPSGDPFIVPSNLFIIGTMNTADKSIALLDIALRRRFEFESMYPRYDINGQEIYDVEILKKINEQIIKLKGYDFQIGHAYFMGENDDLVQRMNKKVIPLLLEYFMNDEKEVKEILKSAGLSVNNNSWPLTISGKDD